MKRLLIGFTAALAAMAWLAGCKQENTVYSGPDYLMFSDSLYNYAVQESNEVFNVPVAATTAKDYDRNFAVEIIDKESNAVEGRHYRLEANTVTIKAGEMVGYVQVQGIYNNIEIADSIGFTLRLIVPEEEQWDIYGTKANVVLHKVCPFDIHNFSGYCLVTSTFLATDYMQNVERRLITSDVVEGEENTVVLHGLYLDGYDSKITFDRENPLEPLTKMDKHICGNADDVFGTVHGDGNLMLSQSANYISYYNTCQDFVFQYVTVSVDNEDGSEYGVVGTYINLIEWISEAEAEKLKEQGL